MSTGSGGSRVPPSAAVLSGSGSGIGGMVLIAAAVLLVGTGVGLLARRTSATK